MKILNIKILSVVLATLFLVSCTEDFLDINKDPNNPTEASIDIVLTSGMMHSSTALGMSGAGLSSGLSVWTHQVVQRRQTDKYAAPGGLFFASSAWTSLYAGIADLNYVIEKAEEDGNMQYVGMTKIYKAYLFSQMVDCWGDIPFSEANTLETTQPVFDDDAEIYTQIFAMIDEGLANINDESAENLRTPGAEDVFFGGNIANWVTFAKTLKLKLYNQVRLVQDVSSNVNAILSEGDIINSAAQDFELWYANSITPMNMNPGHFNEYQNDGMEFYISPWLYEIMKGYQPNGHDLFPNEEDPRIPYYWYKQLTADDGGQNATEYRDGGFITITFGSDGQFRDNQQDVSGTVLGVYPIGGRYDDDSAQPVDANTGMGIAPLRLLTHYATLFIRAELANAGVTSEDPKDLLSQGMQAAFDKVNQVADASGDPTIAQEDIDTYMTDVLATYDAADNSGKLEIIMTQKWLASYGYAVDQYTDYRRTGYPLIFDPNTMTMTDPDRGVVIPTSCSVNYPFSLEWVTNSELELNANAPDQKQKGTDAARIFWDVD